MSAMLRIAAPLVLIASAGQASAYNYFSCSLGGDLIFPGHITMNFADDLTTAEKAAISRGLQRATQVSDTSITAINNFDSDHEGNNGENEIYRDNISTADCRSWVTTGTCSVVEVDMRFGNLTWVTTDTSQHEPYIPAGTGRNMTGVAVHEAGHCLGLAHSDNIYNMMGHDWTHVTRNGTAAYYGPGEDMSDGLIDKHGKKSANDSNRDVGITVFRYDGPDGGGYSRHVAGEITQASVAVPVVGTFDEQDVYQVVAGETVQMELTLENNGEKNAELPNIGYYLSTNSSISTLDTLLKTNAISIGRGFPLETAISVTIPAGTAPGNYFLGAFIDHDNQIAEVTNANNVAYYPIEVVPPSSDLTFPFFALSKTNLALNESFTAYTIVRNDGDYASTAGNIHYYKSSSPVINKLNPIGSSTPFAPLSAGSQRAGNTTLQAPQYEYPGALYFGACIEDVANELVTNNNCSTGVQVQVKAPPPIFATGDATSITTTGATLNGTLDPNGATATAYFEWGETTAYGNSVPYGQEGPEPGVVPVSKAITGLTCNTQYHFRIRVVEADGVLFGEDRQFTTAACPGC